MEGTSPTSSNGGATRRRKPRLQPDPTPHSIWGRFKKWWGFKGKTPYDLLSVVLIPLMIVISLMYARLQGVELGRRGLLGGLDLQHADLASANLSYAHLSNTSLRGANLFEAYLQFADLTNADLRGACLANANLRGADLADAEVTREQLDQADSLEGATMPDAGINSRLAIRFGEKMPATWSVSEGRDSGAQPRTDVGGRPLYP